MKLPHASAPEPHDVKSRDTGLCLITLLYSIIPAHYYLSNQEGESQPSLKGACF
jgi:hypothetical protein